MQTSDQRNKEIFLIHLLFYPSFITFISLSHRRVLETMFITAKRHIFFFRAVSEFQHRREESADLQRSERHLVRLQRPAARSSRGEIVRWSQRPLEFIKHEGHVLIRCVDRLLVGAPWDNNRKGDIYKCIVGKERNSKCSKMNLGERNQEPQ